MTTLGNKLAERKKKQKPITVNVVKTGGDVYLTFIEGSQVSAGEFPQMGESLRQRRLSFLVQHSHDNQIFF